MSDKEKLNEDCGCGGTSNNIRNFTSSSSNKRTPDPMVGKEVSLVDGRKGIVDDAIRNNTGEVIGYVIEGGRGKYRVFKNKILEAKEVKEQDGGGDGGGFASLDTTIGMGDVVPRIGDQEGSGDQFPTLGFGTRPSRKKKKKTKNPLESDKMVDTSLMDFDTFIKNSKENQ